MRGPESGLVDIPVKQRRPGDDAGQDFPGGGGVTKQRIARPWGGKSGGFRTIILFRTETRAVFVYGFEKNARDNIDAPELAAFRRLASQLLARDDGEIETALQTGALIEVLE
jgi:hypothetical protein